MVKDKIRIQRDLYKRKPGVRIESIEKVIKPESDS